MKKVHKFKSQRGGGAFWDTQCGRTSLRSPKMDGDESWDGVTCNQCLAKHNKVELTNNCAHIETANHHSISLMFLDTTEDNVLTFNEWHWFTEPDPFELEENDIYKDFGWFILGMSIEFQGPNSFQMWFEIEV